MSSGPTEHKGMRGHLVVVLWWVFGVLIFVIPLVIFWMIMMSMDMMMH